MSFKMGSNWAIFIEQEIIKWTYGIPDTNQEFLDTTVRFLSSLQQIGRELYEQGVASIQFERPVNKEIATNEIFIINLSDQFFFVISDISITARLLAKETIPYDIQQILCAVLVGQGAILYSYLKEGESTLDYSTDETYRSVLTSINVPYDLDSLVSDGRCSLSPLKLEELLLFHYLLRNKLETKFTAKDRTKKMPSWALMVDRDGLDVPLAYLTPRDPLILGNFLGAIYSYVQALFGVKPSALVFGGHDLVFLRFFGGKKYFLAASTDHIFDDKEFIGLLFAVPDSKRLDLAPSVKEFLIEKCSDL
ncbi:MAG TPA: hypothetical protein VJ044_00680, partial [Candidatus Hodarchaeales archaeon]|nr:hypothetical protein [Candidatus Hodarchaeales archaeon]